MSSIARRLDHEAVEIKVRRQRAGGYALLQKRGDARLEVGEKVHERA